jgi:hypothetical protein
MKMSLLFFLLLTGLSAQAQVPASVAGTWKRTSTVLVDAQGKSTDVGAMMKKSMPCASDIRYTFRPDGTMEVAVPDACGPLKKQLEATDAGEACRLNGKTLTVTSKNPKFPTSTYELTTAGKTMTWVHRYADNPQVPNPTKAQSITITYERL